jgi:hypothetical protein
MRAGRGEEHEASVPFGLDSLSGFEHLYVNGQVVANNSLRVRRFVHWFRSANKTASRPIPASAMPHKFLELHFGRARDCNSMSMAVHAKRAALVRREADLSFPIHFVCAPCWLRFNFPHI